MNISYKKIIFTLLLLVTSCTFSASGDLFRPAGTDILKNCSILLDSNFDASKLSVNDAMLQLMCITAINNTYQTIRGPMVVVSNADMVCYQNYYELDKKSPLSIVRLTIDYIQKHLTIRDMNLSTIMSVMMKEYYPIPYQCKK